MSRKRTAEDDYVSLSSEDLARFHRNAPAALARRSGTQLAESLVGSLELVVMGATPIVGMLWFGWSATQLFVFLIAGMWVGIFCDLARLALAGRGVKKFVATHYDDWHVWVVVEALRAGRATAPRSHLQAAHQSTAGVFVDLAAGTFSTALMAAAIAFSRGKFAGGVIFDRSFVLSIAGMAAYQAATAAWEIARHRRAGAETGPVQATPGVRGVGLFMLMFVAMTLGDPDGASGLAARRVMLAVNGVVVAVGVLNAASWLWLGRETAWLRKYLRGRPQVTEEARPVEETKRKRRKAKRR